MELLIINSFSFRPNGFAVCTVFVGVSTLSQGPFLPFNYDLSLTTATATCMWAPFYLTKICFIQKFIECEDQVSYPYATRGRIIVLYILVFLFLDI
jgi:low affinity Fe/Cu permease